MLIAGRYEIGGQIGSGGSGSVYRGRDLRLQRDVAIKIIPAANRRTTERQLAEIRTMAAATGHPNVVALYDALLPNGEDREADDAGHAVLVMELVDGPSLSSVLADGPLPLGVVRGLGANLAAALAHLHQQGIVHRDIKPANVLIAPDGQAKLADFGISRLGAGAAITSTGFMIGTAGYLSPEQVEGDGAGPYSDVYSLGLVLLEALTGRREYIGTPTEAALARLARQPDVPADLPSDIHRLLTAMLARDRSARPAPADVVEALAIADLRGAPSAAADGATARVASADTAVAGDASATTRLPVRTRTVRRRGIAALAAVAAIVALLGAGRLMGSDGDSGPNGTTPGVTGVADTIEPGSAASVAPSADAPSSEPGPSTAAAGTTDAATSGAGAGSPDPVPPAPPVPSSGAPAAPAPTTAAAPAESTKVPPGSTRGNSSNVPGQTKEKTKNN